MERKAKTFLNVHSSHVTCAIKEQVMETKLSTFFYYWQLDNKKSKKSLAGGDDILGACGLAWAGGRQV